MLKLAAGARPAATERFLSRAGDFLIAAGLRLKGRRVVASEHIYRPLPY
jgi:hypothetical protein